MISTLDENASFDGGGGGGGGIVEALCGLNSVCFSSILFFVLSFFMLNHFFFFPSSIAVDVDEDLSESIDL